ncbi:hypothetical protein, partial [Staphylococcus argenteus]|uniref:hypothetical protein n=1 Tax=Staphylococcus argenteus TaxID=985002 RepID=UPI000978B268
PARLTRIEKSLLQAHFHSVNYCQYNIIELRTLFYVPSSFFFVLKYYEQMFAFLAIILIKYEIRKSKFERDK